MPPIDSLRMEFLVIVIDFRLFSQLFGGDASCFILTVSDFKSTNNNNSSNGSISLSLPQVSLETFTPASATITVLIAVLIEKLTPFESPFKLLTFQIGREKNTYDFQTYRPRAQGGLIDQGK